VLAVIILTVVNMTFTLLFLKIVGILRNGSCGCSIILKTFGHAATTGLSGAKIISLPQSLWLDLRGLIVLSVVNQLLLLSPLPHRT